MYLPLDGFFAVLTFCFPSRDSFFIFSNIHLNSLRTQIATPKKFPGLLCEMMRSKLLMCQVAVT